MKCEFEIDRAEFESKDVAHVALVREAEFHVYLEGFQVNGSDAVAKELNLLSCVHGLWVRLWQKKIQFFS